MADADSHALAAAQLRDLDRDRYAASLVIPRSSRADVQALFAFSADVAAIRERVSEPAPGEIRLQWWIDALEGEEHGEVRRNPVADALLDTISRCGLPAGPLVRLLAARRFDLYNDPMSDIGQFEGYAGETISVLFQYAAMILAGGESPQTADAAGHLGVAQGLVGHLRAFGYNASRGQLFLPLSVFTAHGVREADIYAGLDSAPMREAVSQILDIAQGHAHKARAAIAALPSSLRPAFASLVLVEGDLRRLERSTSSPFAPPPPSNPFSQLARLIWWSLHN